MMDYRGYRISQSLNAFYCRIQIVKPNCKRVPSHAIDRFTLEIENKNISIVVFQNQLYLNIFFGSRSIRNK